MNITGVTCCQQAFTFSQYESRHSQHCCILSMSWQSWQWPAYIHSCFFSDHAALAHPDVGKQGGRPSPLMKNRDPWMPACSSQKTHRYKKTTTGTW